MLLLSHSISCMIQAHVRESGSCWGSGFLGEGGWARGGGGVTGCPDAIFCLAGMHALDDLPYGALAPGVMKKEKHPRRVGDY